jgi:predicted nucleotidyltransferase
VDQAIGEQITAIKEVILQTIPVEKIYLFGSYAYGNPREDSDLDIYVVMKDDAPYRETEAAQKIWTAIHGKKSMPADILVARSSRFQYRLSAPTLEQEVSERGIAIYG